MAISEIKNNPSIVEQGVSGMWSYRKWSDGMSECWGRSGLQTVAINTPFGNAYYGSVRNTDAFPSGLFLNSAPTISCELIGGDACWAAINTASTTRFTYYPYCPKNGEHTFILSAYCMGRWK